MPVERNPVSDTHKVIRSLGFNPKHVSSTALETIIPHVNAILGILELHKAHESHEGKSQTDALALSVWETFQELPSNLIIHDLYEWDSGQITSGAERWHDFMSGLKSNERKAISRALGIFKFKPEEYESIGTLTDLDVTAINEGDYKRYKIGPSGARFFKIAFQGATPEELSGNIQPKE